jgi:tRNA(fMet)-specific endonuclease VapC
MQSTRLHLLDTCILIHAVRASNNKLNTNRKTWDKVKAVCDPLLVEPTPVCSIVSKAELLSFGKQRSWDEQRINAAEFYLDYFTIVGIENDEIIRAYTEIDTFSRFYPTGMIKMGKNDLWIAATAYVLKANIITTDKDFDHLHGIFFNRIYIEPER